MDKRIIGQNGQGVQGLTLVRASTQWNSSRGRFGTLLAERLLTCLSLIVLTKVLLYIGVGTRRCLETLINSCEGSGWNDGR